MNQEKPPHWIRLEDKQVGAKTAYIEINLADVFQVTILRKRGIPSEAQIHTKHGGVGLGWPTVVASFLKYWDEYNRENLANRIDPESQWSDIDVPETSGIIQSGRR